MNASPNNSRTNWQERNVQDYALYRAGDIDPASGKKIVNIIACEPAFIVYLDEDYRIEWSVTEKYETYSKLYGEVLNKVAQLEGISEVFDMAKKQKREYRLLLGAAIGRMLEKEKSEVIRQALQTADTYLKDRITETARIWYLSASLLVTLSLLLFVLLTWIFQDIFISRFGWLTLEAILAIWMGALGALISVVSRSNKLSVNVSAGRTIHYVEGATRIVFGMLGALLVILAVKGDLLLGVIASSPNSFFALLAVCLAAGASERIAPSIIKQVEGLVEKGEDIEKAKGAGNETAVAETKHPPHTPENDKEAATR